MKRCYTFRVFGLLEMYMQITSIVVQVCALVISWHTTHGFLVVENQQCVEKRILFRGHVYIPSTQKNHLSTPMSSSLFMMSEGREEFFEMSFNLQGMKCMKMKKIHPPTNVYKYYTSRIYHAPHFSIIFNANNTSQSTLVKKGKAHLMNSIYSENANW